MAYHNNPLPQAIVNVFNKIGDLQSAYSPADSEIFDRVIKNYLASNPQVGLIPLLANIESILSLGIFNSRDFTTRLRNIIDCLCDSVENRMITDLARRQILDLALVFVSKLGVRVDEIDEDEDEDEDDEELYDDGLVLDAMDLAVSLTPYATMKQLSVIIDQFKTFSKYAGDIIREDIPAYELINSFAAKIKERSFEENEHREWNRLMTRFVNIVLEDGKKIANAYPITALISWTRIFSQEQKYIIIRDMYQYFTNGPRRNLGPGSGRDYDGVYCNHHLILYKEYMKPFCDRSYQDAFELVFQGLQRVKSTDPKFYDLILEGSDLEPFLMLLIPKLNQEKILSLLHFLANDKYGWTSGSESGEIFAACFKRAKELNSFQEFDVFRKFIDEVYNINTESADDLIRDFAKWANPEQLNYLLETTIKRLGDDSQKTRENIKDNFLIMVARLQDPEKLPNLINKINQFNNAEARYLVGKLTPITTQESERKRMKMTS